MGNITKSLYRFWTLAVLPIKNAVDALQERVGAENELPLTVENGQLCVIFDDSYGAANSETAVEIENGQPLETENGETLEFDTGAAAEMENGQPLETENGATLYFDTPES